VATPEPRPGPTQLIVIGSQQALLHESIRYLARGPLIEAAVPDRTLKDRQNSDQDLGVPVLHRVRHWDARIDSHDTTMPRNTDIVSGHGRR